MAVNSERTGGRVENLPRLASGTEVRKVWISWSCQTGEIDHAPHPESKYAVLE